MTRLLEKAFEEVSQLPEIEQNAIARWLMEEVIAEKKWAKLVAESEDALEKMADEALKEHIAGKTEPLSIDNL
jgi:hypothetical protein